MDENRHEKVELLSKMVCGSRGAPPLPPLTQVLFLLIPISLPLCIVLMLSIDPILSSDPPVEIFVRFKVIPVFRYSLLEDISDDFFPVVILDCYRILLEFTRG